MVEKKNLNFQSMFTYGIFIATMQGGMAGKILQQYKQVEQVARNTLVGFDDSSDYSFCVAFSLKDTKA